ncbi:MAG: effector-associated domain 2-containing protein [Calditrichia bacterium]
MSDKILNELVHAILSLPGVNAPQMLQSIVESLPKQVQEAISQSENHDMRGIVQACSKQDKLDDLIQALRTMFGESASYQQLVELQTAWESDREYDISKTDRSAGVDGNVSDSVIITGDNNKVYSGNINKLDLPDHEENDGKFKATAHRIQIITLVIAILAIITPLLYDYLIKQPDVALLPVNTRDGMVVKEDQPLETFDSPAQDVDLPTENNNPKSFGNKAQKQEDPVKERDKASGSTKPEVNIPKINLKLIVPNPMRNGRVLVNGAEHYTRPNTIIKSINVVPGRHEILIVTKTDTCRAAGVFIEDGKTIPVDFVE